MSDIACLVTDTRSHRENNRLLESFSFDSRRLHEYITDSRHVHHVSDRVRDPEPQARTPAPGDAGGRRDAPRQSHVVHVWRARRRRSQGVGRGREVLVFARESRPWRSAYGLALPASGGVHLGGSLASAPAPAEAAQGNPGGLFVFRGCFLSCFLGPLSSLGWFSRPLSSVRWPSAVQVRVGLRLSPLRLSTRLSSLTRLASPGVRARRGKSVSHIE